MNKLFILTLLLFGLLSSAKCEILNSERTHTDSICLEEGLHIYPNPAKDFINVTYNNLTDANVELYTILGIRLYYTVAIEDNLKIDLTEYASATYIIKINTNNYSISKLIIKK